MPDRDEAVARDLASRWWQGPHGQTGEFCAAVGAALAAARREERERAAAECDRRARRAANSAQLTVGSGAPWIQFQARMHEADDCASAIRTLPPRSEADRG